MALEDTLRLQPVATPRSLRTDKYRGITSMRAGLSTPIAYFPLLREDRISGRVDISVKMSETVRTLLNAVKAKATAWLVPHSANPHFKGMDDFNASYQGVSYDGQAVKQFVPVLTPAEPKGTHDINNKLGIHITSGLPMAAWLVNAYNMICNERRQQRSTKLPMRLLDNASLARAFWMQPERFSIVPDFDHAMLEGEMLIPLSGVVNTAGATVDLAVAGRSVISLANMAMLEKTQAFARLKQAYADRTDEHLIDLLMEGIRVPEESLREPQLLGAATGVFGMMERHASDGASLGDYVATGEVRLSINIQTPPINPGGVVMVILEIAPEVLQEFGTDLWLYLQQSSSYPNYMRDYLDPEKVESVYNREIDAILPNASNVFGYRSLNGRWNREKAHIGGKFYATSNEAFKEDRARFWQVIKPTTALNADWYLCPQPFPHDVFADTTADPFEVIVIGNMNIVGNTLMSPRLLENRNSFAEIVSEIPLTRIGHTGGHSVDPLVEAAADTLVRRAPKVAPVVPPVVPDSNSDGGSSDV